MLTQRAKDYITLMFKYSKLFESHMSKITYSSKSEFMILCVIHNQLQEQREQGLEYPGVKVSVITKQLKHSMPATSKMLNLLEEKGYVTRINSKHDRRTVYVTLTNEGDQKAVQIIEKLDDFANTILNRFGDQNSQILFGLLEELYQIAEEEIHSCMENNKEK